MTTPTEERDALLHALHLLYALSYSKPCVKVGGEDNVWCGVLTQAQMKRMPWDVRLRATRLLKHFPGPERIRELTAPPSIRIDEEIGHASD